MMMMHSYGLDPPPQHHHNTAHSLFPGTAGLVSDTPVSNCCATNADVRTHPATLPRAARADDDDDDDDGTALELVSDRGAAIGEFDVVIDAAGLYSPLRSHRVYGNFDIIVDHLSRISRLFAALNTPVQCWCPGLPEAEWGLRSDAVTKFGI